MATNEVKLLQGLKDNYVPISPKDNNTLYFTTDEQWIYLGGKKLCNDIKEITLENGISDFDTITEDGIYKYTRNENNVDITGYLFVTNITEDDNILRTSQKYIEQGYSYDRFSVTDTSNNKNLWRREGFLTLREASGGDSGSGAKRLYIEEVNSTSNPYTLLDVRGNTRIQRLGIGTENDGGEFQLKVADGLEVKGKIKLRSTNGDLVLSSDNKVHIKGDKINELKLASYDTNLRTNKGFSIQPFNRDKMKNQYYFNGIVVSATATQIQLRNITFRDGTPFSDISTTFAWNHTRITNGNIYPQTGNTPTCSITNSYTEWVSPNQLLILSTTTNTQIPTAGQSIRFIVYDYVINSAEDNGVVLKGGTNIYGKLRVGTKIDNVNSSEETLISNGAISAPNFTTNSNDAKWSYSTLTLDSTNNNPSSNTNGRYDLKVKGGLDCKGALAIGDYFNLNTVDDTHNSLVVKKGRSQFNDRVILKKDLEFQTVSSAQYWGDTTLSSKILRNGHPFAEIIPRTQNAQQNDWGINFTDWLSYKGAEVTTKSDFKTVNSESLLGTGNIVINELYTVGAYGIPVNESNAPGIPASSISYSSTPINNSIVRRTNTGTIESNTPINELDVTNKIYVDNNFVKLASDTTQIINSNISLGINNEILGLNKYNEEENLIILKVYSEDTTLDKIYPEANLRESTITFDNTKTPTFVVSGQFTMDLDNNTYIQIDADTQTLLYSDNGVISNLFTGGVWIENIINIPSDKNYIVLTNTLQDGLDNTSELTLKDATLNVFTHYVELGNENVPFKAYSGLMTGELTFDEIPIGSNAINLNKANIAGIGTLVGRNDDNEQIIINFNDLGQLTLAQQNTKTWTGKDVKVKGILTPTDDNDAANKKYVDDKTSGQYLPLIGGTVTGQIRITTVPTGNSALDLGEANLSSVGTVIGRNQSNKQVIMDFSQIGEINLAVQDTSTWTGTDVKLSGVLLPTSNNHAANKEYVDTIVSAKADIVNYSTDEVDTGSKWVTDQKIYRKTIAITLLDNAQLEQPMNINNLDQIIKVYGMVKGQYDWLPLPFVSNNSDENIKVHANAANINITTYNDRSDCNGYITIEYTCTDR